MEADNIEASITLITRNNLNSLGSSATALTGWGGFAPVRGEGVKMAVRVEKPTGVWDNMSAIQVDYNVAGRR